MYAIQNCFFQILYQLQNFKRTQLQFNHTQLLTTHLRRKNKLKVKHTQHPIINRNFLLKKTKLRCVPLGWSELGSVIRDHSDYGRSNESMNPLWTRIHRFIWSIMIRVILIRIILKERTLSLSINIPYNVSTLTNLPPGFLYSALKPFCERTECFKWLTWNQGTIGLTISSSQKLSVKYCQEKSNLSVQKKNKIIEQ